MGQELSSDHSESNPIHQNHIANLSNPHLIQVDGITNLQRFSTHQKRNPSNNRNKKKLRIFDEWIPLSLPLESKKKTARSKSSVIENIDENKKIYTQTNYFSQQYMKKSFFVFESRANRKVPKMQKIPKKIDENKNPNCSFASLKSDSQRKSIFRKTMEAPVKNKVLREVNGNKIDFLNSKHVQKLQKLEDSIINQWFETSEIGKDCRSEKQKRKMSKKKKIKVQKASGIFCRSVSKAKNQIVLNLKEKQPEKDQLINIADMELLESKC